MALLTRDEILAAAKATLKVEEVEVKRLGGAVRLKELTTTEMFAFRKETKKLDDEQAGLHLVARCWLGEDDKSLFSGEDGVKDLGALPLGVLEELTHAVLRVNGLGEKAAEAAEKN
jgi:hypothetical protein